MEIKIHEWEVAEEKLSFAELILWKIYQLLFRNFPLSDDLPFFKPFRITINPGKTGTVEVPVEGMREYYLMFAQWSQYDQTMYKLSKDDGALILDGMEFNVQPIPFRPPEIIKNKILLKITNNSNEKRTYEGYFCGFKRMV